MDQVKEAAEQVVKRKRGGGKNSPVIGDQGITATPDELSKLGEYALEVFNAPVVDLTSPEAVEAAIQGYIEMCIKRGIRPGNLGMYAVLGLDKREVSNELTGRTHKLSPAVLDSIKKGKRILGTYREGLALSGKLNPATAIFWGKNFDGMEDETKIEIAPKRDLEATQTVEQIEADIPIDVD